VGAVGEATAAALAEAGWTADLVADPPLGEELARLLQAKLEAGARIATVRGNLRAGRMDAILAEAGFELVPVEVYENAAPEVPGLEPFAVAAVFAASPSAARRLLAANPWMAGVDFVAIGPTTAAALEGLGVTRVTQAGKDFDSWVAALTGAHERAEKAAP
jgi:uroporphyrinogen-III synthase